MNKKAGVSAKPLTSRQLASLIGVSQSAVSRAFTPGSSISEDLRQRILKGAQDFGYQPNAIASSLTTRRSNIIGIVVSDTTSPFHPALIGRLTQGLQNVGFQSLLFNISHGTSIQDQLNAIRTYNVDGVVVVAATVVNARTIIRATEGRRSVLLNRLGHEDIMTIGCDDVLGIRTIVDHLYDTGHRRLGYVCGPATSSINETRIAAFTTRLAELGIRLTGTAASKAYSYEDGWKGALELIGGEPEGIVFGSDLMALGGLDAMKQAGVADRISVVGFDDIPMAGWAGNALTTYRQPMSRIVKKTVELLTCDDPGPPEHHAIPGKLIVRSTTIAREPDSAGRG